MSKHFSANQYQDAFKPRKLVNHQIPREHQEHPQTFQGFTQFIATDRGHLYADVKRGKESPWGNFVPTWDMPKKIPGPKCMNPTARSLDAQAKLRHEKEESDFFIYGKNKDQKIRTPEVPMPSYALPPAPVAEDPRRSGAEAPAPLPNDERPPSIKTPSPVPMMGEPVERLPSRNSPANMRQSPTGIPAANELNVEKTTTPKPLSPDPMGAM